AQQDEQLDERDEIMRLVQPEDLVRFGMIPEFIGRLPVVSVLNELSQEDLEHILQNTRNSLVKQFAKLFSMENVELRFTKDALAAIAKKALELKTGARALRAIMEEIMLEIMYEIPQDDSIEEVVISAPVVRGTRKPQVKRREGSSSGQQASDTAA
ncbi:MAG: ATP-dependent Clp protease ATP-binding subunit ClpX, partial [Verrucomicrobiota bacterium]